MDGSDLEARIAALEAKGWLLVHAREPRTQNVAGVLVQEPGSFRFEKIWRNHPVSEIGETLAQAVAAAEWQERRISDLDDKTTPVLDGLISQEEFRP